MCALSPYLNPLLPPPPPTPSRSTSSSLSAQDVSMGGVSVAAILARRAALAQEDSDEESDEDWDD